MPRVDYMSDASKYLPLSGRGVGDESRVSSDWSSHLSATLGGVAALLDRLPAGQWHAPALQEGYTIKDTVGHLVWHLGTPRVTRMREILRVMADTGPGPRAAVRALSRDAGARAPEELVRVIRSLAADAGPAAAAAAPASASAGAAATAAAVSSAARAPSRRPRRGVGDLSVAVVGGYDLAQTTGLPVPIDRVASGAVALARSLTAATPVRAVIRGRTLVATDAGWTVGHGPELAGTASSIVLFLWGRGGMPRAESDDEAPV